MSIPFNAKSAILCDRHIQPRVATDASLALALAKIVLEEGLEDKNFIAQHSHGFAGFRALLDSHSLASLSERCGVAIGELRDLARAYATTKPASIQLGWGLNKYKSSAEMFRCVDALAALCGQIGIAGGGVTHGYDTQRLFDKTVEAADRAEFHRTIPEPLLGRGLLEASDPPVRMMFVNGGNPVNQSPNSNLVAKALTQLEFVVVVDSFLTDTTDYAHIFLPTTTFLEEEDALVSWGHNILGGVNPAIDPVGESRSDLWIVQQLADRLGIGDDMAGTPREWLRKIMGPMESEGVTVDALLQRPIRCPVAPLIPFADKTFPTKSGRFEFITGLDVEQRKDPAFPLTLVTNFSKKWLLSQMTEAEHPKLATVRVGDDWATGRGIENGQQMRLRSAVGELVVEVQVDPRVGKDMVIMAVGTWIKRGGGANLLTEDVMSNFGEMAAYGETRVALEPLEPAPAAAPRSLDLQVLICK